MGLEPGLWVVDNVYEKSGLPHGIREEMLCQQAGYSRAETRQAWQKLRSFKIINLFTEDKFDLCQTVH